VLLHIVKQGECLSSIAAFYGFSDWRVIYEDGANADFRQKRPNPNLIYPDDKLYIPDHKPGQVERPTDARHFFVVKRQPTLIDVRVQNLAKDPIKNAPYKVVLENTELEGSTDDDGWIKREIHASDEYGTLIVWPDPNDREEKVEWRIQLGHLDPAETVSGVKGRLRNLNYFCGEMNDEEDECYHEAVRRFQEDHDLVVDGIVGAKTRARLKRVHRV
jgi:N-acetylmuramoyl-L-alanine amidase